jgi:hypothetical protein
MPPFMELVIPVAVITVLWITLVTVGYFKPRVWEIILGKDSKKPE